MSKPNPENFVKNERPTEFEARFRVDGEVRVTIKADSLAEAKAKADAMLNDDDFGLELTDIASIRLSSVWKSPAMYLVTRDGRSMQTSRLQDGDEPREPDEHGF